MKINFAFVAIILSLFLVPEITNAQISRGGADDDTDRRQGTGVGGTTFNFDLTGGIGSFYFVDELGINLSFRQGPLEDMIDQATYILGPGDLISLKFEGGIDGAMRGIVVNPQGDIVLPNFGTISVNDLTIREAVEKISVEVKKVFRDTEVSMSIEKPRLIKIHIVGDVPFPGVHIVSAQTRLDQALYLSFFELPMPEGARDSESAGAMSLPVVPMMPYRYPANFIVSSGFSMRNIHIDREDGTELNADLVSYFRMGDRTRNPIVRSGDIITVNRLEEFSGRVAVSGAVKNRMNFEYRVDDTLDRLVRLVGGLTEDSKPGEVKVFRNQGRQVETVDFETNRFLPLEPNDRIVVPYDRDARQNHMATVHGEAKLTGHFPIRDGETTADELLAMAGGLSDHALPHGAYLVRTRPGRSTYGSTTALNPERMIRSSDQYLQGFEYIRNEAQVHRNEVFVDLTDSEQLQGVTIFDGDQLYIPRDDQTIYVFGQVNNPGYFPFMQSRDAYDYIQRAGGFSIAAEDERVFVIKAGSHSWFRPHETTVESGDVIFVDRIPYDDLASARAYDIQRAQLRNSNIQLIMTGITTITGIITTYVAITR